MKNKYLLSFVYLLLIQTNTTFGMIKEETKGKNTLTIEKNIEISVR